MHVCWCLDVLVSRVCVCLPVSLAMCMSRAMVVSVCVQMTLYGSKCIWISALCESVCFMAT